MCTHSDIAISPTPENSWGIEDTYNIKCIQCGKTIRSNICEDEIQDFIHHNNCRIISGKKYLSRI